MFFVLQAPKKQIRVDALIFMFFLSGTLWKTNMTMKDPYFQ